MGEKPAADALEPFVASLAGGDIDGAQAVIARLEVEGVASVDLYSRLFAPAMATVGELWESGAISVVQEHIASSIMERLLAGNYPKVFVGARASRERVMMACVPGERHVLALRMSADLLEGAGYRITFVGADPPRTALLEAAQRDRPSAIVLAAEGDYSLAPLEATINSLHQLLPETPIIIGGDATSGLDGAALDASTVVEDIGHTVQAVRDAMGRSTIRPPR